MSPWTLRSFEPKGDVGGKPASDVTLNVTLGSPATSLSLVGAVRGSATIPGNGPTFRSGEVPDQRLPRGATHSCSAPPTAPTRSKSAS